MGDVTLIILIVTIIFIVKMVEYFSSEAKIAEDKLERTSLTNDYGIIKDGDMIKIRGEIVFGGRTLNAPFSNRKCVYYYFKVNEVKNDQKHLYIEEIIYEEKRGDVIIKHNDYYALIETSDSEIFLAADELYSSNDYFTDELAFLNYLEKIKIKTKTFWGHYKKYEYDELILNEGKTITVYGKAKWVPSSKYKKINIEADKFLLITSNKPKKEKVYISDILT